MRARQLSAQSATTIDRTTNIVLIPIRCTCATRPDDGQFTVEDVRMAADADRITSLCLYPGIKEVIS